MTMWTWPVLKSVILITPRPQFLLKSSAACRIAFQPQHTSILLGQPAFISRPAKKKVTIMNNPLINWLFFIAENYFLFLLSRLFGIRQIQHPESHRAELLTNKNPLGDKKRNERKKLKIFTPSPGFSFSPTFSLAHHAKSANYSK